MLLLYYLPLSFGDLAALDLLCPFQNSLSVYSDLWNPLQICKKVKQKEIASMLDQVQNQK